MYYMVYFKDGTEKLEHARDVEQIQKRDKESRIEKIEAVKNENSERYFKA